MTIRELRLTDLSKLQSRAFICEFGGEHNPTALILEFVGKYGIGSLGNADASYMHAVTTSWLTVYMVDAVVFDLRRLEYVWGDSIWNVFHWGFREGSSGLQDGEPRMQYPTALVVSELCRKGFSTCEGMVPRMFDELEAALRSVESPAREYLEAWSSWIHMLYLDSLRIP